METNELDQLGLSATKHKFCEYLSLKTKNQTSDFKTEAGRACQQTISAMKHHQIQP